MKVALFEVNTSTHCYECGNQPELQAVAKWEDLTHEQYAALVKLVQKHNMSSGNLPLLIVGYNPSLQQRFIDSIPAFIEEQKVRQVAEDKAKEEKRLQKLSNKKAKDTVEKRKLLDQLKKELGE